jgi:hypothetical protein
MLRPLLAIFRRNIQLIAGSYYTYNGSVVLCALYIIRLQFIIYLANPHLSVKRACGCCLDVDKNISLLHVKILKLIIKIKTY